MRFSLRLWALLSLWLSLFAAGPLRAQTGTDVTGTIMSGGVARQYQVYVPKSYQKGKPVPLLFQLHPHCWTGPDMENLTGFRQVADTANFLLVTPTGTWDANAVGCGSSPGGWTWNTWEGNYPVDDTGFLSDLLTQLESQYSVDAQRVYSTGYSNGGFMSYALAAQLSNRIAAIGSISGSMVPDALANCTPARRPVPVVEIHGTNDQTVPLGGGAPYYFAAVPDVLAKWAQLNGCAPTAALVQTNAKVRRSVWSAAPGDSTVVLYEMFGATHNWPVGDGAETKIWRFLRKYRLPLPASVASGANLALNKPVSSSALEHSWLPSSAAVDGNVATRWSTATDQQWLVVDLGANYNINEVKLNWAEAYGINYTIDVSPDATNWTTIKSVNGNSMAGQFLNYAGLAGTGRYVRLNSQPLASTWGCSINELEVYGTPIANITASGVYELEPQNAPGQRLDVYNFNPNNLATVALFARNGGTNQQWKFIARGNGIYELAPQHAPGQRLDVYGLNAANNAPAGTWSSNGGTNQQWKAIALGGGVYELEPQCAPGKRLDIGVVNGVTQTVSNTATGGTSQRWKLYAVGSTPAAKMLASSAGATETGALSVFPNPATATVTLSGVAAFPATVEVHDMRGARLSCVFLTQASDELKVQQLPAGLYTLRVSSAQTVQTVRLQKN